MKCTPLQRKGALSLRPPLLLLLLCFSSWNKHTFPAFLHGLEYLHSVTFCIARWLDRQPYVKPFITIICIYSIKFMLLFSYASYGETEEKARPTPPTHQPVHLPSSLVSIFLKYSRSSFSWSWTYLTNSLKSIWSSSSLSYLLNNLCKQIELNLKTEHFKFNIYHYYYIRIGYNIRLS